MHKVGHRRTFRVSRFAFVVLMLEILDTWRETAKNEHRRTFRVSRFAFVVLMLEIVDTWREKAPAVGIHLIM